MPRTILRQVAGLLGLALLGLGCRAPAGPRRAEPDPLGLRHPLRGRIFDLRAGRIVESSALLARLPAARFLLLGEKHDNREHHRLQARMLRALADAGRRPVVLFEMITDEQREALAAQLQRAPRDVDGLGRALRWDASGWPPWPLYRPIFEVALETGLAIEPAGLGRAALHAALRDTPPVALPASAEAGLARSVRESHCGHASEEMVARMVKVQLARDLHMARAMIAAGARDGAVLIAGGEHARRDRGAAFHLSRLAPQAEVLSVALLEVNPRETDPRRALEGEEQAFDYAWFSERVDDADPCESFRRQLERMGQRRRAPAAR